MSLIGKSVGNYHIKAKLGEGGMGAVYLGEHPLIGKRVAVKVLLEELAQKEDIVQRFFNEAKAVNDIGHQNIVDVVDFGKMKDDDGKDIVYFVMEFLDGDSLQSRLRNVGVSFNETLYIMRQACSALAASHVKGIVHRDLKPDNLYLCRRGDDRNFVKILDFGIAKLTGDGPVGGHKTRTGLVIGTPAYMSPEQCEGRGNIDPRSDVYSLGVVMYEMLTGKLPFEGEGFGEIIVAHMTRQPEPPSRLNPGCPLELEAIVLHALEKSRDHRFANMREFEAALTDPAAHMQSFRPVHGYQPDPSLRATVTGATPIISGERTPSAGSTISRKPTTLSGSAGELGPRRDGRGSTGIVAAGLVALLGLGGGGAWFFLHQGKSETTAPVATTTRPNPPVVTPAAPESIVVKLTSEPPGAKVLRADKGADPIGTTPYTMELRRGEPDIQVQLKLDGFQTVTKLVTADMNKEIPFTLVRVPEPSAPAPAPAAVQAAAPTHKSSGSSKRSPSGGDGKAPKKSPQHDDMSLIPLEFK